jgi:hypothetical protein
MGDMPWAHWEHARQLQVMSLSTGKKIVRCKFTEMPMTENVMNQIDKWAKKDRTQNGLTFLNRKGMEYKFKPEAALFPDIPAEVPGILSEHEEVHGASPIQDKPAQSNKEGAALAAENSGMEFRLINVRETREVIELLDDNDEDVLN